MRPEAPSSPPSPRPPLTGRGRARFVDTIPDLASILEPGPLVAVVLRRAPDIAIRRYAASLLERDDVGTALVRVVETTDLDASALAAALPSGDEDGRRALAEDLALWAEVACELTGAPRAGLRLTRTARPICPGWHVDKVTLRLVLTYAGAGTDVWVEEGAFSVDPFDVVVLKGEAFPGNAGRGVVHRSPPGDAPRLVLTIDALA